MRKGEETRGRMIQAAAKLIEEQGYAATGLMQVLAEAKSPRGSLYFHFPGGKEDLAAQVIEQHAATFGEALSMVFDQAPTALAAAELSIESLAMHFEGSGCTAGCPVTVITLEMANRSDSLRDAVRAAFDDWVQRIASRLVADGHSPEGARSTARALLSAIEGALILCRAYGNRGPLDDVKALLPRLLSR